MSGDDDDAFGGSVHNQLYACITLVMTIIGFTASFFMILLIYRMRTPTGFTSHILLVLMMSYAQLVYDFTFFFRMVNCGYYLFVVANFFQIFTSTTASIFSNWISIIALMIVVFKKKMDANKFVSVILCSSLLPGLLVGFLYLASVVPQNHTSKPTGNVAEQLFYYLRLLLIFINFVLCGIIIYEVEKISSKSKKPSMQEIAIRLLSRRMIFYPLIQALGRLCFAVYEQLYGFETNGAVSDPVQYEWLLAVAIVTPLVSVGYLVIFIVMQPEAKRQFIELLQMKPIRHKDTLSAKTRRTVSSRKTDDAESRGRSTLNSTTTYNQSVYSQNAFSSSPKNSISVQQRVINYSTEEDYYDDEDDDERLLASLEKIRGNDLRLSFSRNNNQRPSSTAYDADEPVHRTADDSKMSVDNNPRQSFANNIIKAFGNRASQKPSIVSPSTHRTSTNNPINNPNQANDVDL